MFTGLVEQLGQVHSLQPRDGITRITIVMMDAANFACELGDSVAVNGVCLTVVGFGDGTKLEFEVSSETMNLTSLGQLKPTRGVNLERALRASDRLGGHLVSGHVDGQARVVAFDRRSDGSFLEILVPTHLARYVAMKGSITLDGVSLTVNQVHDEASGARVAVMLIPLTLEKTTLNERKVGDSINIEVDLVARYLERLLKGPQSLAAVEH